jgi:chitin-binding protein
MNIKTETRNNNEAPIIENLSITWNSISLSITPNPFYPVKSGIAETEVTLPLII